MGYSNAISGMGTLLYMGDNADPEAYSVVAEVTNINDISFSADTSDVTHMESPGGVREFITTVVEGGEINIEANFVATDASQNLLRDAVFNRTRHNFVISLPFSPKVNWRILCAVTNFSISAPHNDKIPLSVTLKPSGIPEFDFELPETP